MSAPLTGLCAETDPELFYPEPGASPLPALALCRRCPVQAACLDHALTHDERFGIWGGTTPQARRRMTRRQVAS